MGTRLKEYRESLMEESPVCWYCGWTLPEFGTLDHLIPRSKGGPDVEENVVLCCRRCNQWKSNADLSEIVVTIRPRFRTAIKRANLHRWLLRVARRLQEESASLMKQADSLASERFL